MYLTFSITSILDRNGFVILSEEIGLSIVSKHLSKVFITLKGVNLCDYVPDIFSITSILNWNGFVILSEEIRLSIVWKDLSKVFIKTNRCEFGRICTVPDKFSITLILNQNGFVILSEEIRMSIFSKHLSKVFIKIKRCQFGWICTWNIFYHTDTQSKWVCYPFKRN